MPAEVAKWERQLAADIVSDNKLGGQILEAAERFYRHEITGAQFLDVVKLIKMNAESSPLGREQVVECFDHRQECPA